MNRLLSITLVCLLNVSLALASAFNLKVEVTPVGAGSLNTSGGTYEEGSNVYLYTYRNTGYVFKGWYEGDKLLSSSTSFNYTMPSQDVTVQARYEYDPDVPGNPAMPDTTTYYNLKVDISPYGAGSVNITNGRYAAGANVYIYAYRNTGYRFVGWQDDQGKTLSESTSFNYTMPRRDVQLTALFSYDPDVPANPDSMATLYSVTLVCKPAGGGSFNTNKATAEEGGNVRLYAYTNTGYKFLRWEDSDGNTLATTQDFYYVMPHANKQIYGVFDFDPETPSNPAKNYWNKELGEVIIDDFKPNELNSAVRNAIGNSSTSEVAMITVAGRMGDYDFGVANNYENCTLLDLSRVTGITVIPSYAFDYTKLESIYLPATIEKIGYCAFYQCTQLASVTIYAMTPPSLESQVFTGVPDGLVVYVPAASIGQYQEAAGWKDFTILPIQEDIRNISISLPAGTRVEDYCNMWLELTNTKNGQKLHYVMTDRMQYTFANIIRNTSWNVILRNERGDIFGQIDNVEVKDEDVSVTFESLTRPQNVTLMVMAGNEDVTSQVQVAWTDAQGNYLAQGVSLTGLPTGYQATYRVTLSQELAMAYITPQPVDYVLTDGDNSITCLLNAIPRVKISGKVKDALTGLPLSGAVISASQTFGGKYSKTLNAKTDGNGAFTLDVANVPTSIAFAASDHVSQTVNCDSLLTGVEEVTLPDVSLKSITGATITLGFTYTSCEGETQNGYSDYQNVSYELFNVTKNKAVSQFKEQYPQIVLLEEVTDGDVLRLTATSRTNAFNPVTTTATIVEQKAEATFAVVELGKIQSSFTSTGNAAVVGSLYDAAGKLLKTYNYSEASLTISDLADGTYTLVSMGSSRLFNTIYDLAQLPQTGLVENVDYVLNQVQVKSGHVSVISINEVPTLDETKLYYTGDNTSFTVNKPSIVAGNYLTLTGRIDFKPAYATSVSNVQMIVDLPESCEFVENSVMVGNSTSSYTLNGTRLTIPLVRYTDRVRFCIIPTLGGEYAPSAFAQFELNGETVTQPIGSANYTAKDLSIVVPSVTAKASITVSGTAIGTSAIEIYDGDVLIGQTSSLANGVWSTTCELFEPENLSSHYITAKVTTKQGLELQSETIACLYDEDAVMVNTVTMINTAHTAANLDLYDYVTVFDFQNPQTSIPAYWYWPSYPKFTFLIDITYHDIKLIPFVWLHVFTSDGNVRSLRADYDVKKDRWIAIDDFTSEALPTRVSVTVENMVFDPSSEATYEILMDKYVGEISLKDSVEEEDGSTTYNYTDGNGDDIASVTTFESDLTVDELVEKFKEEGFEEDELLDDDSDYVPEDEDDVLKDSIKVLTDSITGSIVLIGHGDSSKPYVAIIRLIREEDKQKSVELVSSTITREWKSFFRTYFDPATCTQITEYKRYQEHLDKYVTTITSTLVAYAIFVDYRKLPLGTKIPRKQILARIRRIRHSSKRYTTSTIEYSVVPKSCPPPPPPPPPVPPTPPAPNVQDPSGFVYEGVTSNRVEGVTATAYYKEMVEDMYGDLHENIVKWDAEEYAQENPLFTDENGMYAWDVPQGLWQVKFEKEGYETTYSEWLPVPPPQLDVNIAIKQNRQPEVKAARAYEDAVEVEFDKYMIPELLTSENIMVMQNGTPVEGSVELQNEEAAYEGSSETYATKARFNAAEPFTAHEITLFVSNRVKSYADIRMQDDYSQTFSVEHEVKQIVCDSLTDVDYGKETTITVSVLPALASKGKTLTAKTSSSMILDVKTGQVTIGDDGTAEIVISGELPGTAALTFSVEGTDKTASTIVNVEQIFLTPAAAPIANIASGAEVEKGTQIILSCKTLGATIYYTLDGTCPCDENGTRQVWDGTPIIIYENVTIRAMAVAPGTLESEVVEFVYTVKDDIDVIDEISLNGVVRIYPLPVRDKLNVTAGGIIIQNVTVTAMNGMTVASSMKPAAKVTLDVSAIPTGIYIINIVTTNGMYSRKIQKIE